MRRDADPVRALGFIAMYSGNLEGKLRELLLKIKDAVPNANLKLNDRMTLGYKITELKKFLNCYEKKFGSSDLKFIELKDVWDSFDEYLQDIRNPIIHGSITAPDRNSLVLRNGRSERKITISELYDIAEIASALIGQHVRFQLALNRYKRTT